MKNFPGGRVNLYHLSYACKPPLNPHANISRRARGLIFDLSLPLHPYFVNARNEGSGKNVQMLMLTEHWPLTHVISTYISRVCPYILDEWYSLEMTHPMSYTTNVLTEN